MYNSLMRYDQFFEIAGELQLELSPLGRACIRYIGAELQANRAILDGGNVHGALLHVVAMREEVAETVASDDTFV